MPTTEFMKGELDEVLAFVKEQRDGALTFEEKADILLLSAELKFEFVQKRKKNGKRRSTNLGDATNQAVRLLHRKPALVREIWKQYHQFKALSMATIQGGNHVPRSNLALRLVQEFVRARRVPRARATAKDIMNQFAASEVIQVFVIDRRSAAYKSAFRAVQRFLSFAGYKRGEKKKGRCYHLSEHVQAARGAYVLRMQREAKGQKRRFVFADESFIHHNYSRHDDFLYDPNDEQDLQVKAKHKGRQLCFIAAIVSADESIPEAERATVHTPHFLEGSLGIFEGGKQTVNYHGMFNHAYFSAWMKRLLGQLSDTGIRSTLIILHSAKYHKFLSDDTPKSSYSKNRMREAWSRYAIPFDEEETRSQLWVTLADHISRHVKPVVYAMAKAAGHEVLFTPPHCSDLQPVELVWTNVKGNAGSQYTTFTTFTNVKNRLQSTFNRVSSRKIAGCINKVNGILNDLYTHIRQEDELKSDDEVSDSSSDDSDVE